MTYNEKVVKYIVPHQLREQIQKAEALAEAIWKIAAVFVPKDVLERAVVEEVGERLMGLRSTLRDFLCCELEQKLADQEANPLPTAEQIQAEMDKARRSAFVKPPIEVLLQAQQKVSMMEEAIAKIEELEEGNPVKEYAEAILIPQYQIQLEQDRAYLSHIQKAMEEPDGTEPGEGAIPDEAKPKEFGESIDAGNGQMLD